MPYSTPASPPMNTYIAYGRGGAGNLHQRSSIVSAWSRITSQPQSNLTLTSSPDDHYASSKSEPRNSSRRRSENSSVWSISSAGSRTSSWKRIFRRGSREEKREE